MIRDSWNLWDWGHKGVETDLYEVADHMIKWEEMLSAPLGLTEVDIHDITVGMRGLVLQRLVPWYNS